MWAWNLVIGQSSSSCTCTLFSTPGVEMELIFALRATVKDTRADFQNFHIWACNLAIGQTFTSCVYTLLQPQGTEIELISALRGAVSEIWADFPFFFLLYWV